ncbi:MAG: hypothetical protein U0174_06790 [Polyangiaceae bacterium]
MSTLNLTIRRVRAHVRTNINTGSRRVQPAGGDSAYNCPAPSAANQSTTQPQGPAAQGPGTAPAGSQ